MLGYILTRGARSKKSKLQSQIDELREKRSDSEVQVLKEAATMTALIKTSLLVLRRQKEGLPDLPMNAMKMAVASTYQSVLREKSAFKYKFKRYNANKIVNSNAYMHRKKDIEEEDVLCGAMK